MLSAATGAQETAGERLEWDFWIGDTRGPLVVGGDGALYVAPGPQLVCIAPDGVERWRTVAEGVAYLTHPTVGVNGAIHLIAKGEQAGEQARDFFLVSIDANGQEQWRSRLHPEGQSQWHVWPGKPVLGQNGTIVVPGGFQDSTLFKVADTGALLWQVRLEGGAVGATVGADGTIYVISTTGRLHAVSSDGEVKWSFEAGSDLVSAPCIAADGTLYLQGAAFGPEPDFAPVDGPALLHALTPEGEVLWEAELPWTVRHGQPVIDGQGRILVVGLGGWNSATGSFGPGTLYAFWDDGGLFSTFQAEGVGAHSYDLVVDDTDRAYLWIQSGRDYAKVALAAVDVNSGAEVWRLPLASAGGITMSANGTLYVGSGDRLYAVTSGAASAASGWPMTFADPGRTGRAAPVSTAIVGQAWVQPRQFGLLPAYPNPFNASVAIPYELSRQAAARLAVYDVAGQLVEVLVDGQHGAGRHEALWDAAGRASGVYLVELWVREERDMLRVALVR